MPRRGDTPVLLIIRALLLMDVDFISFNCGHFPVSQLWGRICDLNIIVLMNQFQAEGTHSVHDREKTLKDLLGINEQVGRILVSTLPIINSNSKGSMYNLVPWASSLSSLHHPLIWAPEVVSMIYRSLVTSAANEMPTSILSMTGWLFRGDV